jgi:hypothetical protein
MTVAVPGGGAPSSVPEGADEVGGFGGAVRRRLRGRSGPGFVPTDSHLDELLRYEESATQVYDTPAQAPWRLKAFGYSVAITAVVYTLSRAGGLAVPLGLIAAVVAAGLLIRRAVAVVGEPVSLRAADLVRPPGGIRRIDMGGWFDGDDGMVAAVRRWDRRLDWGSTGPERFTHTVPSRFGELVDERLRQHHGFTRAGDPARARALLGEAVWTFLHEPVTQIPSPGELAKIVQRMETL